MPVTRLVNTAIDGVATDPQAVLEDILRFSSSDLVCYRADGPEALVARQAEAWDPILDWVRSALGARFFLAEGVMHVEQPREAIGAVGIHLRQRDDVLRLAALHVITAITGSALLALGAGGRRHRQGGRLGCCPCRRGLEHRALGHGRRGRGAPRVAQARHDGRGRSYRGAWADLLGFVGGSMSRGDRNAFANSR